MKPVVDYDECTGCATCVELCPEVFELRDFLVVLSCAVDS